MALQADFNETKSLNSEVLHSNGYQLQEVEDGWYRVTGRDVCTRLKGPTAEELSEGKSDDEVVTRPYVSRRYFNTRDDEPISDISEGQLGISYFIYINSTLPDIQSEFQRFNAMWQASEACKKLQDQMSSIAKSLHIQKVVCFAIGTFQDGSPTDRCRAHLQLAALLTIKAAFDISTSSSMQCFMQDPVLTTLDSEFLLSQGFQTIHDPDGFSIMDGNTLVYLMNAYDFIYRKISECQWPGMLVCDTLDVTINTTNTNNEDDGSGLSEAEIQVLRNMFQGYEEVPLPEAMFPGVEEGECCVEPIASTAIYWRRTLSEGAGA
ncbi:MAG: hypothetical protein Q9170_002030 [Blastenia crenularia]